MMQFSKSDLDGLDKQQSAEEIQQIVESTELTLLEATTQWLEERCVPENMFAKVVPRQILEAIKAEALEDNLLKPSFVKASSCATLDFMYG